MAGRCLDTFHLFASQALFDGTCASGFFFHAPRASSRRILQFLALTYLAVWRRIRHVTYQILFISIHYYGTALDHDVPLYPSRTRRLCPTIREFLSI